MSSVIELRDIIKTYEMGDIAVKALKGVSITVSKGEFVAVMGASGSGKSTLMNILGCLDKATSGDYLFEGINISELNKDQLADIRNEKIGFVFQGFNLLSRTTALENVELPLMYDRSSIKKDYRKLAEASLIRVGLEDRMFHHPNKLSGGQQQRVAIARSLVNSPKIILADEPTGNLDTITSLEIMGIFQELNNNGITIILVTHEPDIATYAKRVITVRDGLILEDYLVSARREAKADLLAFSDKHKAIAGGGV